jgi:putative ABC transport system permease protein
MSEILLSGVSQGLIWAILALGVFVSYRILDVADLSCEGSITLGASVAAMLIWKGFNPILAVVLSFLAGCVAGMVTGLLHTKLKIPAILSGILTMISLYSINIHIMSVASGVSGTANLSLLKYISGTMYTGFAALLNLKKSFGAMIIGVLICVVVMVAMYWFFGTEIGSALRATGNNEKMCRAQGINTDKTKIIGLAISNGLIAMAGALLCQFQGYADVNMGVGAIVIGLASIIIGEVLAEAFFGKHMTFWLCLSSAVIGGILYYIIMGVVLWLKLPTNDMKLFTAIIVAIFLAVPYLKKNFKNSFLRLKIAEMKREKEAGKNA